MYCTVLALSNYRSTYVDAHYSPYIQCAVQNSHNILYVCRTNSIIPVNTFL